MRMSHLRLQTFGFLLVWFFASTVFAAHLECRHLRPIEQGFLNQHIKYNKRSLELENRLIDQYIEKIDSIKLYLLQSDVDDVKKMMKGIYDKIKNQDCSVLDKVQELYVQRVKERMEFARKTLKQKTFKFDKSLSFVYDPDQRKYAKTKKELNEFQLKYLQFQISNYIATDMVLKEAKDHVIRNYERLYRRVKDLKKEDVYANYLDAGAKSYDPHSSFFSKEVLEDFEINMKLSLEGIGATLSNKDGFTVIEQLIAGGAAEKTGKLEPKDMIVSVGQGDKGLMENVIEWELRDVVRKIRGPKDSIVRLQILRKESGKKKSFIVKLKRDKINLEDEAAQLSIIERTIKNKKIKVGVVNLPSFYADSKRGGRTSSNDLKKLLIEANSKGVSGLVLDLSNNGGGSLEDAVKIAGLFFKTGNVVKQSSRMPSKGQIVLKDTDESVDFSKPLVVLTSRISASASEIVAGTLQDYQRAVIVGSDHTFGKGSVQSVVPIPQNLGALKVTVGMFYIPAGESTQHSGVSSNIIIPSPFDSDDIGEKTLDYSLPPTKIQSFISDSAFVHSGEDQWDKIDSKLISELKKKSQDRVAKNTEFKKIVDDLKKAKEKGKVVQLNELLKEQDKKKEEDEKFKKFTKEERIKEYLKKPGLQEAVNVIADIIEIKKLCNKKI